MIHTFVIRRDQPVLFRHLRAHFTDVAQMTVILDRRYGDRRRQHGVVTAERRHGERRTVPARTWTTVGYVIVSAPIQRLSAHALT
jgi:hypothetical protein